MKRKLKIKNIEFKTEEEKASFFHSIELSCFFNRNVYFNNKEYDLQKIIIERKNGIYILEKIKAIEVNKEWKT